MKNNRPNDSTDRARSCSRTRRYLSAFLDGEVDAARGAAIREHLLACPKCVGRLEELIQVAGAMHDLLGRTPPLDSHPARFSGIVRRLEEQRRQRLGHVLEGVLAIRLARELGSGLPPSGPRVSRVEQKLLRQARSLARELAALNPVGEKLALARLDRWLQNGSVEELRDSGLLRDPPPRRAEPLDSRSREEILRWVRQTLRRFREQFRDEQDPTRCPD